MASFFLNWRTRAPSSGDRAESCSRSRDGRIFTFSSEISHRDEETRMFFRKTNFLVGGCRSRLHGIYSTEFLFTRQVFEILNVKRKLVRSPTTGRNTRPSSVNVIRYRLVLRPRYLGSTATPRVYVELVPSSRSMIEPRDNFHVGASCVYGAQTEFSRLRTLTIGNTIRIMVRRNRKLFRERNSDVRLK